MVRVFFLILFLVVFLCYLIILASDELIPEHYVVLYIIILCFTF